ncbi:Uracil-DNA glycosylase-like protein [Emericellopsis cladophorae]|uniref:Uracil-DNA glycosylase n=1 Tax=Emericellopsis cladophorae TaxID=2686198 RepID=A0A9P9Y476_9HYPO|nr:Uracil-DNA glycosylase-like protein [Emericellopsis cladophorae]KAI6783076.1 Uracil-DNA glycosylase-like protein [Emericellopsis cladophorae]
MSNLKRKAGGAAEGNDSKKPKANGSITSFFGAPKVAAPSTNAANVRGPSSPSFDKQKWVDSLKPEQRELLKLEIDTLHESWLAQLKDDIVTKEFLDLKRFLAAETKAKKKWFPPAEDVYSWSRHTPFDQIKVVIVGQDPYHNDNQAHGMAFSVRPPTPAPPSLRNMYIALKKDYPTFTDPPNRGGLLTPWADRGVLLLNTCLTVRAHEAFSHANRGWERLTQKVLDLVAKKRTSGVVFIAWGTPAGKRVQKIDRKKHLVLNSVHPSPLSASRGFFDCKHFKLANEWLISRYGPDGEIDWALTPGNTTKAPPPVQKDADKQNKGSGGLEEAEIESGDEEALEEALKLAENKMEEAKMKAAKKEHAVDGGVKEDDKSSPV